MPKINILTEADLREVVSLDADSVACVEDAFKALATKSVVMPPILSMEIADHHGEGDVKTAYLPGLDSFAIKMSPGFFDNPTIGLPRINGLMVVFSAKTGLVEALLLDNGYLTDLRTAAAGAVAAKWLAREDASRVGIAGAGTQARLQLQALTLVRPIKTATIWARDGEKAAASAAEFSAALKIPVTACPDLGRLAVESDILVTTTPATSPLITAEHLKQIQSEIDAINEVFIEAIATGRNLDAKAVRKLADGRMFVGYPHIPDRYIDVPLEHDVIDTLRLHFGTYGGTLAQCALRYRKPEEELIFALAHGLPDLMV